MDSALREIEDAHRALAVAQSHFDEATDPEQVAIATHELTAAGLRLNEAYARAKAESSKVA